MKNPKHRSMKHSDTPNPMKKLSDVEVMQLHEEALRQYEDLIQIAELPDYLENIEEIQPRYDWDAPIGLDIKQ